MKISACIASRGRPELLGQTVEALRAGMKLPDTAISIALDQDDPELSGYLPLLQHASVSVSPREDSIGAKYNRAQRQIEADVYVLWPDDAVMSEGWDEKLAAANSPTEPRAILFGSIPGVLCPGLAVNRPLVDAMGFFCQPYTPAWWHETWTLEVATMADSAVKAEIDVSLLQGMQGKSRGIRDVGWWAEWFDWTRRIRVQTAADIILASATPGRVNLHAAIPAKAEAWRQSNSVLRDPERAAALEKFYAYDAPEDERYRRIKAQAEQMLERIRNGR